MFNYLKKNLLRLAFLIIPALALLVSCGPERMLGDYYIKKMPKGSILVIRPDFIYKSNKMRYDLSDQMREAEKDSVAFYRSSYLQYVSDSVFLDEYMNNFINRLLSEGFDVYAQEYRDSFMTVSAPSYIVNVAQLQLEESRDSSGYASSAGAAESSPSDLLLTTIRLSSWLEFKELNADSANVKKLFYASSVARDAVTARALLMPQSAEIGYQLKIDTLTLNDVYELARQSGKTYGDYLIDYMMNEYISRQMPNGMVPQRYMHYDSRLRRVRDSQGEGFQEIEPGK